MGNFCMDSQSYFMSIKASKQIILAWNPNIGGILLGFYGVRCHQIVFPNLTVAKKLHISHKPCRFNHLCGRYGFFCKDGKISKDFQDKIKWWKMSNIWNGRYASNFTYFSLISFVLSSALLIHTFRHQTCCKTSILTELCGFKSAGQIAPPPLV